MFAEKEVITIKFGKIELKQELTACQEKVAMLANAGTDILLQTVHFTIVYSKEKWKLQDIKKCRKIKVSLNSEKKLTDEGKDFLKVNRISYQHFANKTFRSKNE